MQNKMKIRGYDTRRKVMLSPERLEKENYALGVDGCMVKMTLEMAKSDNLLRTDWIEPLLWTGRKDNKGRDIYEEDIFRCGDSVAVVTWSKKSGGFVARLYTGDGYLWNTISFSELVIESTVIGNTFQNKDLIPSNYEEVRNQQSHEGDWENGRLSDELTLQPRGA